MNRCSQSLRHGLARFDEGVREVGDVILVELHQDVSSIHHTEMMDTHEGEFGQTSETGVRLDLLFRNLLPVRSDLGPDRAHGLATGRSQVTQSLCQLGLRNESVMYGRKARGRAYVIGYLGRRELRETLLDGKVEKAVALSYPSSAGVVRG